MIGFLILVAIVVGICLAVIFGEVCFHEWEETEESRYHYKCKKCGAEMWDSYCRGDL